MRYLDSIVKNSFYSCCALLLLSFSSFSQGAKYHMLVGTYTSPGKSEGLYVYEFDPMDASMKYKTKVLTSSPSFFAVSADQRFVYTVSENKESKINAFSFDSKSGELNFLNSVPSGSSGPTHISVDPENKHVFVSNYSGGSVTIIPIAQNGYLESEIQDIKHEGGSTLMKKSYVHSAVLSPDFKSVFVADLGTDKVNIYNYDSANKTTPLSVAEQPFVQMESGAGPRHSIFHPNGKYYYVVRELDAKVSAFKYKDQKLELLQTLTLLPESYKMKGDAADIQISSDGRFLYASTRNALNEIVIFSIKASGKLQEIGRHSTQGRASRTFQIDPSGKWLLVTNQGTNEVVVLSRNQKSGLLSSTGKSIAIDKPSYVKFLPIR